MNYKEKYFEMRALADSLICFCHDHIDKDNDRLICLEVEFEKIDENY